MDPDELQHRFAYHRPTGNKGEAHEFIRNQCAYLASRINAIAPDCREKSLAITALEEAMLWTNAAIARNPETSVVAGGGIPIPDEAP